jgi:hypothetical protein
MQCIVTMLQVRHIGPLEAFGFPLEVDMNVAH